MWSCYALHSCTILFTLYTMDQATECYRSVVCGFHMYKMYGLLTINEEHGNPEDQYAIAIAKPPMRNTVGHVPKEISRIYWHKLQRRLLSHPYQ